MAEAARAWAAAAYRQFFALREALGDATREVVQAEIEAEQAEVLDSPWHDIAAAFAEGSSG